jgi:hypothetical protein
VPQVSGKVLAGQETQNDSEMAAEAMGTGSSSTAAVVVRTLWSEYAWPGQNKPDVSVLSRREMWEGEKLFDILTVKSDVGDTREIYFDVTACFSRPTAESELAIGV